MSYCVGILLDEGMVLASDTRARPGGDASVELRKMRIYEIEGDRVIVVVGAGDPGLMQRTLDLFDRAVPATPTPLWGAESLLDIVMALGACMRKVQTLAGTDTRRSHGAETSFIVGGQVRGERPRLFMVYPEGNCIESTPETPFFQIGETKYGKPIIDRVVQPGLGLSEAVKCVLISFDSTMRSNDSVGMPIDLALFERNGLRLSASRRFTRDDAYFGTLHRMWGEGLRAVFDRLPDPAWEEEGAQRAPRALRAD